MRIPLDERRQGAPFPMASPANDPFISIEEAIRHYADSQPSQLYRGGA
ncbi:hypothetical protein D779_4151 [Imhoffiella purpurea]|uniref:Uncharacterized protein n=1 Tax=Imhoffiella purpurea TaxID=1249627 RepID=W9VAF7_9GAMM|nr:hypothetical protein D779_4151 [Imhoffiella purpurea]